MWRSTPTSRQCGCSAPGSIQLQGPRITFSEDNGHCCYWGNVDLCEAMGTRAVQPLALGRGVQGVLVSDRPAAPWPFAHVVQTSLYMDDRPLIFQALPLVKHHSGCPSSCFLAWRLRSGHTNARGNEKGKGGGRCETSFTPLEVCSSRRAQTAGPGVERIRDNHKRVESAAGTA